MPFIHFDHAGEDPPQGLRLVSMSGVEAISELFQYDLVLEAEQDAELDPADFIGQDISLRVDYFNILSGGGDRNARFIHGIVSSFKIEQSLSFLGKRHYSVQLVPELWFLTKSSHFQIFENQKSTEIISSILSDHSINADIATGKLMREHCIQHLESDYDFVTRLMLDEGLIYYFDHSESEHKLHIAEPTNFSNSDALTINQQVTSWSPSFKMITGKWEVGDYSHIEKSKELNDKQTTDLKAPFNTDRVCVQSTEHILGEGDKAALKRRVEILKGQEDASCEVIEVSSQNDTMCAGASFSVNDDGYLPRDTPTNLVVVEAAHYMNANAPYSNNFSCIPAERGYWGQERIDSPVIRGPMTAMVVENVDPQKLGRIRVAFPQFGDGNTSTWMRVTQIMSGNEMGAVFTPRLDDEVVISFINGNPDRPIVTGSLYNGTNILPSDSEDGPFSDTRNGIITPSTELIFEDKPGEELLHVRASKDYERVVVEKENLTIGADRTIKIEGLEDKKVKGNAKLESSANIEMKASTDVKVEASSNINIKAGTKIELKVGGNTLTMDNAGITLKVGGNSVKIEQSGITVKGIMVKVEGSAQAEVKAPMTTVSGDGMLTVKGGVVMIN